MLNGLFLRIDGRIIYSKEVTSGLKKGRIKAVHFCCKSIKKDELGLCIFVANLCKLIQLEKKGSQFSYGELSNR